LVNPTKNHMGGHPTNPCFLGPTPRGWGWGLGGGEKHPHKNPLTKKFLIPKRNKKKKKPKKKEKKRWVGLKV